MSEKKDKLPRRLQGTTVFDRVQREVLRLRYQVEDYRRRRRKSDEDDLTKDVYDALDDLSLIVAEAQGLWEVLEGRVYPARGDVLAAARAKKERAAGKEENPPHVYRATGATGSQA